MIQLQLYDNNLTTPVQIYRDISDYSGLKFSTKLHGGFSQCSFKINNTTIGENYDWAFKRPFYRVKIYDTEYSKTLWEGRLQGSPFGLSDIEIRAYGYYASLLDGKYATAYNDTADVVIKAILTAQCPQISADQTNIQALDADRDSSTAEEYLDKSPQALIEFLLGLSDSTKKKWYFTVWEDRVAYVFPRVDTTVDWYVKARNLQSFSLAPSYENLWNSCYAIYRNAGVLSRTTTATDATSISKYGITRTYVIPDLGEVALAGAEAVRDTWIEEHKDVISQDSNIKLGKYVVDAQGREWPSSHVRAGDVIQIKDILPATEDMATPRRNGINTFYILETQYDVKLETNRLIVDTANNSLDAILSRKLS